MRVLAVAQAFKGTLPASAVAKAVTDGLESAGVRFTVLTGSDGGDGLLDAIGSRTLGVARSKRTPCGSMLERR